MRRIFVFFLLVIIASVSANGNGTTVDVELPQRALDCIKFAKLVFKGLKACETLKGPSGNEEFDACYKKLDEGPVRKEAMKYCKGLYDELTLGQRAYVTQSFQSSLRE